MGAPGSPNSTFYNSWAPLWGAPLKYMANRYAKTFSGLKWYVLKQFGAPGSPNSTFYNSLALLVHQTVRFTIVGRPHATKRYVAL